MDKLTKTLQKINIIKVSQEVKENNSGKSPYLYDALKKAYPKEEGLSNNKLFTDIWTGIISRNRTIDPNKFSKLFEVTSKIIQALFPNVNTSEMFFTRLRKSIIDRYGSDSQIYKLSITHMGLSPEGRSERFRKYAAQVNERNEKRAELEPVYVDDILKTINIYKNNRDPFKRAMAVLLATGMRGIELFKVSTVRKINDGEIEISQLAKSKDNTSSIRPVIGMNADEVINSVKFIRDSLNNSGNNQQIEARLNPRLNEVFKDVLNVTSHKARYIYGNISYKLFAESKKLPYESYIQKILAHASADSTKSYLAINLEEGKSNRAEENSPFDSLDQFKNTKRRGVPDNEKINNVVAALKYMRENNIHLNQRDLRKQLGYSAIVMTKGYEAFKN